ncbi:hypothetical protein Cdeb_00324 [Caldibacillus debilis GB1]|uniref:Uncharacterized protein n=1 Tax=Caldibacillus debilis GB1 TaxID=1339248 RepID=A0A420VHT9_9BACI|nr:hypothetical protein Cdeb_00324 [Caldibacillus debilis GB1]
MTFGEMQAYTNRFKEIVSSKVSHEIKDIRLANLKTDNDAIPDGI